MEPQDWVNVLVALGIAEKHERNMTGNPRVTCKSYREHMANARSYSQTRMKLAKIIQSKTESRGK